MMCQKFPDVGPKCYGTRMEYAGGVSLREHAGGPKSEGLRSFIAKEQSYKPYSVACLDVNSSFRGTKNHKIRENLLRRRLCMHLSRVLGPSCCLGRLREVHVCLPFAFWAQNARHPPILNHGSEEDLDFMRSDGFTRARSQLF